MTQVLCQVYDSGGDPLVGYIRVTLDQPITDPSTGQVFVPVGNKEVLATGSCVFTLEPSDVSKTTYHVQVVRAVPDEAEEIVLDFHSLVPDSGQPIKLSDLIPTGVTKDMMDTAMVNITRRIYNDLDFWASLQRNLFRLRGVYSNTSQYVLGDIVTYQGSGYMCKAPLAISNVLPTSDLHWQLIAEKGATGSGTTGSDVPYTDVGWDGQIDAPSKNTVRDIIEQLARKADIPTSIASTNSPHFTGTPTAALPPASDRSSRIATTQWTQTELDSLRNTPPPSAIPVGTIVAFAGSVVPSKWLLCNGQSLDKTVYSLLFAAIGNTYGGTSNTFNLPDLRGRVVLAPDGMGGTTASRVSAYNLGDAGGTQTVALTTAHIPAHSHKLWFAHFNGYSAPSSDDPQRTISGKPFFSQVNGTNTYWVADNNAGYYSLRHTGNNQFPPVLMDNAGSGSDHSNLQPYITLNYIIYTGQ